MDTKAEKKYQAPALEKGLDILEVLSNHASGLSQVEIARELGRSVGEIFRMLVVLCDRGYLTLDPHTDRYALTTKLFEVSHRYPKIKRLTSLAVPVMNALSEKLQQSVHLAIISEGSLLVIGQVDSPGYHLMSVRLGAKLDVWKASSGRVILAHSSKAELDQFILAHPPGSEEETEAIREDLAKVRKKGYEERKSYVIKGVVNISVPLVDYSGQAIACLTIPMIESVEGDNRAKRKMCRDAMQEAAEYLSDQLGGNLHH